MMSATWLQDARNVQTDPSFTLIKHQEHESKIASHVLKVTRKFPLDFIKLAYSMSSYSLVKCIK